MTFAVVVLTVVNIANDALNRLFAVIAVVHDLTSFPGRKMTKVRFLSGFILPRAPSNIHTKARFSMSLFVLSDTHLSHSTDKPMNIFGSRWDRHTEKIRDAWQAVVSPDDTVVIPGDISWAMSLDEVYPDLAFLNELNGKKIISRGNHDYWWCTMKKLNTFIEEKKLSAISFLHNNAINVEDFTICGTRGWYYEKKNAPAETDYQKIVAREVGRLEMSIAQGKAICEDREIIVFFHFPPVYGDFVCAELVDVLKRHDIKRCWFGHIHSVYDLPGVVEYEKITFQMASADYLDFKPLLIK